jgi:hypothetical protein
MKKNIIIIISLLLTTLITQTQTQAQTISNLIVNCGKETDSVKRLVCYDSLAKKIAKNPPVTQNIKSHVPIKESTASATSAPTSTAETSVTSENQSEAMSGAVSRFGMERQIAREEADDIIYAHVSSIKKDYYGKLSVELDNSQTWKQSDSNRIRLEVGERLYIQRGALGSFFMSKDDTNRRVRVKRTK